jgi:hypothetical protein
MNHKKRLVSPLFLCTLLPVIAGERVHNEQNNGHENAARENAMHANAVRFYQLLQNAELQNQQMTELDIFTQEIAVFATTLAEIKQNNSSTTAATLLADITAHIKASNDTPHKQYAEYKRVTTIKMAYDIEALTPLIEIAKSGRNLTTFIDLSRQREAASNQLATFGRKIHHVCRSCNKVDLSDRFNVCARCKYIHYCSQECQRNDWQRHKIECPTLAQVKPHLVQQPPVKPIQQFSLQECAARIAQNKDAPEQDLRYAKVYSCIYDLLQKMQASNVYTCRCCTVAPTEPKIFSLCGKCKFVYYCSKECQKKNWPEHKLECTVIDHVNNVCGTQEQCAKKETLNTSSSKEVPTSTGAGLSAPLIANQEPNT